VKQTNIIISAISEKISPITDYIKIVFENYLLCCDYDEVVEDIEVVHALLPAILHPESESHPVPASGVKGVRKIPLI